MNIVTGSADVRFVTSKGEQAEVHQFWFRLEDGVSLVKRIPKKAVAINVECEIEDRETSAAVLRVDFLNYFKSERFCRNERLECVNGTVAAKNFDTDGASFFRLRFFPLKRCSCRITNPPST